MISQDWERKKNMETGRKRERDRGKLGRERKKMMGNVKSMGSQGVNLG